MRETKEAIQSKTTQCLLEEWQAATKNCDEVKLQCWEPNENI